MNNARTVFELNGHDESTHCAGNQKSKNPLVKDDRSIINASHKEPSNEKFDEIKDKPCRKEFYYSNVLTKEQLNNFRTVLCNDHLNSNCIDPETCFNSHCTAWQRRNPTKYKYSSTICPDIDFSRKGAKGRMSLNCRCRKGKYCEFAHTKEEELYHPDTYKTKKCNAFPNCKRFYCPFIHEIEKNLKEKINSNIIPSISENEKSNEKSRMMEIFCPDSQNEFKRISEVNIGELKQELLMKLVNCQKFVLEEKYSSAQNIAEDFISMIKSLCRSYFLPGIFSVSSNSNIINSECEFLYTEKMTDNASNNHMKDAFHFSLNLNHFLKDEELKRNCSLGDLFTQ
ncbi:ZF-CCCH zinc finger domain-containing protein [Cryptosporidium ubiquitum]|uniref:ZF-CCCH zinc finger domain-containing protein n=1 Tax=Cryptosporidium ubiquitum TaxID=857276 RepID=A0A1J4MR31_9CRYT|nr:ZF-CCCH zinc finger domain-containing protein [Cryptosporidium ubiquitum]OII75349.1 ZF-CCCH zinc finger domain-containing protein [Cryptosporidium ubiquitum]